MSTYFLFCSESSISFPAGGRGTKDEGRGLALQRTKDEGRETAATHQAGAFGRDERARSAITTRQTIEINQDTNSRDQNQSHHITDSIKEHKNTPLKEKLQDKKKITQTVNAIREAIGEKRKIKLAKMKDLSGINQFFRESLKRVL